MDKGYELVVYRRENFISYLIGGKSLLLGVKDV